MVFAFHSACLNMEVGFILMDYSFKIFATNNLLPDINCKK